MMIEWLERKVEKFQGLVDDAIARHIDPSPFERELNNAIRELQAELAREIK